MIIPIRYHALGHGQLSWLDTRYHFSFADYMNPERQGFSVLRVVNDDTIKPGGGFEMHPHQNMEIITYVRTGAITHRDSLGNEGKTVAGDVQVMSAGRGIIHAEYNLDPKETRLYQIWIRPNVLNVEPRWETKPFPKEQAFDALVLLASGREKHKEMGALFIYQDAAIYGGSIIKGDSFRHPVEKGRSVYALISEGSVSINDVSLSAGDGAEIRDCELLYIHANEAAEVLLIDLP